MRATPAIEYRANVKPGADTAGNITAPSAPVSIWLDARRHMRRLRFSTVSQDPQVGTATEQISIDFFDLNRGVRVSRPR